MAALLLHNTEFVLGVLGRDPTLTGRTGLWAAVLEMIRERPWLGYGYSAFWLGWEGKSAYIWTLYPWGPPHAHNGLLELWLNLGSLGILVFVLGFLMSFSRAIVWVRSTRTAEGFWPLAVLTYIALTNAAESTILSINSIYWILYVAVALSIFVPRGRSVKTNRIESVPSRAKPSV